MYAQYHDLQKPLFERRFKILTGDEEATMEEVEAGEQQEERRLARAVGTGDAERAMRRAVGQAPQQALEDVVGRRRHHVTIEGRRVVEVTFQVDGPHVTALDGDPVPDQQRCRVHGHAARSSSSRTAPRRLATT